MNDNAWKFGIAFWAIISAIFFYELVLDKPGPDWLTPVCAVDETAIRFDPGVDYYGDYAVASDPVQVSIGHKGQAFERLEAVTPLDNDRWRATFVNTLTKRRGEKIIQTCPAR